MTTDLYIQIMGCILMTALAGLVVAGVVHYVSFVYDDFVDKREWRKRNETL